MAFRHFNENLCMNFWSPEEMQVACCMGNYPAALEDMNDLLQIHDGTVNFFSWKKEQTEQKNSRLSKLRHPQKG
jgi:hypothetical protein